MKDPFKAVDFHVIDFICSQLKPNSLKVDSANKTSGKEENLGSLTSAVFAISIIAFFTSAIVWSMKIVT